MTCLEDMRTWIFRDNPSKTFTYSTEDANDVQEVIHHMTVHYPDVELSDAFFAAVQFLNASQTEPISNRGWYRVQQSSKMTYGDDSLSWFDRKYRDKAESCTTCTHFTFAH